MVQTRQQKGLSPRIGRPLALGLLAARTLASRFGAPPRPLTAVLCVTNRCNLACSYCYGEHALRKTTREFSTAELAGTIRKLKAAGTLVLQIQGGEPLLREDLPELLALTRELGLVRDLVTNGTLLWRRPDVLELLDQVCVSLDGPPEINDPVRGTDTADEALKTLEAARAKNIPARISAVLTAETRPAHIDWLLETGTRIGAQVNFSPPFDFVPRYGGKPKHEIPEQHLKALLTHIIKKKHAGMPVQFSAKSYQLARDWPFGAAKTRALAGELPAQAVYPRCRHGELVVFIDSDGAVYPCCNFWGRPCANVHESGFEAALKAVSRQGCAACRTPAYLDRNLFFALSPSVWFNYLIQTLRNLP